MCEIPSVAVGLGRVAYERWREALGIPLEFSWGRLPHVTQAVWESVAQAVLEEGKDDGTGFSRARTAETVDGAMDTQV